MRIIAFKKIQILIFYAICLTILIIYVYKLQISRSLLQNSDLLCNSQNDDFLLNDHMWERRVNNICKVNIKNVGKKDLRDGYEYFNSMGIVRNKQDKYIRDIGYKHHAFNALVSNNIGTFRELPDTRHVQCKNKTYVELLPTGTVVLCFYNEHKMTLMRSLKSILLRTPAHLLREIILVDDYSDAPDLEFHLLADLHDQLQSDKIRYIRNSRREGLIRSRVIGARQATLGDVLIFLDSHIEVNNRWIEPLLELIKHENTTLAVPVIDLINADTFEYTPSPLVRGGFNWGLHYKWDNLPQGTLTRESDFKGPFTSPTMAGGLFAINKKYFQHIGEYDEGMDIWGGENLEISFRVWQCGGAIKIVPCSRVGHIFRKRRPYSSPNGDNTMLRNSLRLAYVWMDEYKSFFLKHENVPDYYDYGDISDRIQLRKRLKCHNFDWYLKNIYPQLSLPGKGPDKSNISAPMFQPWHSRKRNYISSFILRLTSSDLCVSAMSQKVKGFWRKESFLTLQLCNRTRNQIWYETDKSEIILDKLLCLEAASNSAVRINKCHEMLGDQQWRHTRILNSPIYNMATGTCLRALHPELGSFIYLDFCSKQDINSWDLQLIENI